MSRIVRFSLALAVLICSTAALAQNLQTNGSSGTGDFGVWMSSPQNNFTGVCNVPGCAGGNSGLYTVPISVPDMFGEAASKAADDRYTSFFLSDPPGTAQSYLSVTFDSESVSLGNFGASLGWQEYEVSGDSNENQLFATPRDSRGFRLDNVSMAQGEGSVPEPGTIVLFATGALTFAGAARRKLSR
jgi:hypothetical protein